MRGPSYRPTAGPRELTWLLALSMALAALGIDLMLPAFDEIRAGFDMAPGSTDVTALVTTYFLGLAIGQVAYGPIADRFGRRTAMNVGYAVYAGGALLTAVSPTFGLVLVSRFVWGLGAAGPRVVTLAVVRDQFEGQRMSRAMSSIMAVFILVPIVAPALGSGIVAVSSWRWVFGVCVLAAVAIGLWALRLPETLRPEHRIERLALAPVLRSARSVLTNRQTVCYLLAMSFLFGGFTSYLGSSENIITETFDLEDAFPLVFGGLAAAMGIAMLANGRVVMRLGTIPLAHGALLVYVVLATAYAGLAAATGGEPPFWLFLIGTGALLCCHALLIPNLNTIAMAPMAAIAGVASSVVGAIETAGAALLGRVLDQAFDGTIRPLAYGFLGYGLVALGLVLVAERGRLFAHPEPAVL
jgi:DHA1 family bicyclomycin/chloramphenicol resistance-like MFS transporter